MKLFACFKSALPILLFVMVMLLSPSVKAQMLYGTITNPSGDPIPFATVFIPEMSLGAAANEEGRFELHLDAGDYSAIFQSMGYETFKKSFSLKSSPVEVDVVLSPMVYELGSVEIRAGNEDPAYGIMRKVIRKAPLFAVMTRSFDADVYIKGSLRIERISAMVKLLATEDLKEAKVTEGSTYLEESVNEVSFTAPNRIRQKVKSIHSTFPFGQESRSSGALGFIAGNLYLPSAFGRAVSPLSAGSFNYYRFQYMGVTSGENHTIVKIKVIPRGKGAQYVRGYLYIVEDLWCLNSVDVTINEQLGVDMHLKQQYSEVKEGAWLPVGNQFNVTMDLLGTKGGFDYHTSIRYHSLAVILPDFVQEQMQASTDVAKSNTPKNEKLDKITRKAAKLTSTPDPTTAQSYKAARLLTRRDILRERDSLKGVHTYTERYTMNFDSNARRQDNEFWNQIRPIPLTTAEVKGLIAYDSLQAIKGFDASDTTSRKRKKAFWGVMLTGGSFYPDSLNYLKTKGIINPPGISYNLVDGFAYQSIFEWVRRIPNQNVVSLSFAPGYAFSRKTFIWDAGLKFTSEKKLKSVYSIRAGQGSRSFNGNTVSTLPNTLYSLFLRDNLLRLYEKKYIELSYNITPFHGFRLNSSLAYEDNNRMENTTDFSFFFKDKKEFDSNIPDNKLFSMEDHHNLKMELMIIYQSMPYYYIKDGERVPRPRMNETPEFFVGWEKSFRFDRFYARYDFLKAGMQHKISLGLMSKLTYKAEVGTFLKSNKPFFNDFKHFTTQKSFFGTTDFYPIFQLNDYYKHSTNSTYVEAHLDYEDPFLLLKFLPIIRNRLWSEKLFFNYNYTREFHHYYEFGYGMGNPIFEVGFFAGFENQNFNSMGLKLALVILNTREFRIEM